MLLSRTSTCIGASGCVHWACLDARSPGAHALGVTRSNVGAHIGRCRSWARVLPMAMTESYSPLYMGTRGPNSQAFLEDSRASWLSGSRRLCKKQPFVQRPSAERQNPTSHRDYFLTHGTACSLSMSCHTGESC